ncbi:ATP:cob(I)alamin adenosyltransferase, partial [Candidatus Kaiserbacteria bacterium]|nr:ATP:cob(I)alamin adenosyltransferase [Candidatus Kaiserbacteria bacterium]
GGIVRDVKEKLFIIQAETAGADKRLRGGSAEEMGKMVNDIEKEIPPIKGFSIAGGTELSAVLDVARTLARRAERRVIVVKEMNLCDLSPETLAYMNRLSSLLFALARLANHEAGVAEENPRY